jgi:amidase
MSSLADDTRWLDATAQAELVASGEVSAGELADAAIERIERLDGELNAVNLRWFEAAREAARSTDLPAGPLAGVPFLLKDLNSHMAGTPMTNGNVALHDAGYVCSSDTELVARFRSAGLVTLGRTSSPELGTLPVTEPIAFGPTRNPWDTSRTPGGSSGGAAAAVASGMVPIAHASDGGGSIRIPASCSGLVGLKPSQGRITTGPFRSETGLGVELVVSRSVRDTALVLDAVHGPGIGDTVIAPAPTAPWTASVGSDPGRLRIGLLDHHPFGGVIDPECAEAARVTARLLEGLGHSVEPGFPSALADEGVRDRFMALWAVQAALGRAGLGDLLGRPLVESEMEPVNWLQAEFADRMSGVDYGAALAAAATFRRSCQGWWHDGFDLLVTPTTAQVSPLIGEHDHRDGDPLAPMRRAGEWIAFTTAFNMSGQPAISLPMHRTATGLPVGVQLVAGYGREDLLLAVAAQLEAAAPWPHL